MVHEYRPEVVESMELRDRQNFEFLEDRLHGNALFPLSVYCVDLTPGPNQETVNFHWHEEVEFILIKAGSVFVQAGSSNIQLRAGQVAFINSQEIHRFTPPDHGISQFYAIVFTLQFLNSCCSDAIQQHILQPLLDGSCNFPFILRQEEPWHKELSYHTSSIIDLYDQRTPFMETAIKGHLYFILFYLASNNQIMHNPVASRDDRLNRIKTVLSYIEENYKHSIRLSELSSLVSMSDTHFCRYFHKLAGRTPIEYINEYRINQAVKLLQNTNLSIIDIAFDVGFQNVSYFIKVFRNYKFLTPYQFRRNKTILT